MNMNNSIFIIPAICIIILAAWFLLMSLCFVASNAGDNKKIEQQIQGALRPMREAERAIGQDKWDARIDAQGDE